MPCTPLTVNGGKQENHRVGHLVCFPPPTGRGRVIDAKGHSVLLARTRVRRRCVHVVFVSDFSYFSSAHDFVHFPHKSCDIISSFCAVNIAQRFSCAANPSIRPFIGCIDECRTSRLESSRSMRGRPTVLPFWLKVYLSMLYRTMYHSVYAWATNTTHFVRAIPLSNVPGGGPTIDLQNFREGVSRRSECRLYILRWPPAKPATDDSTDSNYRNALQRKTILVCSFDACWHRRINQKLECYGFKMWFKKIFVHRLDICKPRCFT